MSLPLPAHPVRNRRQAQQDYAKITEKKSMADPCAMNRMLFILFLVTVFS